MVTTLVGSGLQKDKEGRWNEIRAAYRGASDDLLVSCNELFPVERPGAPWESRIGNGG
jgi:hypothetical protein